MRFYPIFEVNIEPTPNKSQLFTSEFLLENKFNGILLPIHRSLLFTGFFPTLLTVTYLTRRVSFRQRKNFFSPFY